MGVNSLVVDEFGLTPKQRAWCDYYLESGNAAESARKAGYKQAGQSGKDNMRKLPCKRYIADRMKASAEKRIATADEVLTFLTDTMQGRVKDQFGLEASLQDRIKAAQELMRRYAVADQRQQGTLQRLDGLLLAFQTAIQADPAPMVPADPAPMVPADPPAEDAQTTE